MTKEPKKMWRCVNNLMGYCKGEPDWGSHPAPLEGRNGASIPDFGGTCGGDYKTCRKYRTFTQMLEARLRKGVVIAK